VHVAASHHSDVSPCVKARIPVIWVNRNKQVLESSQRKPTAEVPNLREAAKLLGIA
jgi:2-haloacid dehalogenase/putative hydrolase of the HAD superfamily